MNKKPLEIGNIMRVADIGTHMISKELLWIIQGGETYSDQKLKEHIYNVEDLRVEDEDNPERWPDELIDELDAIEKLLGANDCGYFRIIFE